MSVHDYMSKRPIYVPLYIIWLTGRLMSHLLSDRAARNDVILRLRPWLELIRLNHSMIDLYMFLLYTFSSHIHLSSLPSWFDVLVIG